MPPDSRRGPEPALPASDSPGPQSDADAGLIARVKQRVMEAVGKHQQAGYTTVREGDGGWETVAPGVERKILHASPTEQCALWRLAPGGALPGHLHHANEECLVIEGSLRIGEHLVLQAGDFHLAHVGSAHADARTDSGAVIYVRGSPD